MTAVGRLVLRALLRGLGYVLLAIVVEIVAMITTLLIMLYD